ncbi:DUF4349 domain-containing protein [Microbacterium yannicii]|uniref:DUF4349 domain-containing protein n=1 Tax=Microbacterium yannicii TaxID=671622 RepID=UPI0002DD03CA|nr:DUF4349 domain-containing protein [Microbacterium yannicii]
MNSQQPGASASLPEISSQRIDEIENALFADISGERAATTARRTRRGRLWIAGGAAAAVIAVAAIIAPSIGPLVSGTGTAGDSSAFAPADGFVGDSGVALDSPTELDTGQASPDAPALESGERDALVTDGAADREIITTATATVTVEDLETAARVIGNAAVARGGYVESMNLRGDAAPQGDPGTGAAYDIMPYPYPYPPGDTWVTVRVPADQLSGLVEELSDVGEVTASSVNRQDVTEQTVDLAARIEAAQASVDRLTALMAQAESVADLIAAESALSERQALLESYQQQLEMLETQVAMSTLTVTLASDVEPVTADPAGFGDGLAAGWNGLVATLNGIVVALGFLLPWLVVAGVAALIVWAVVRLVRRRRGAGADPADRPAGTGSEVRD